MSKRPLLSNVPASFEAEGLISILILYGAALLFLGVVVLISLIEPQVDIGILSRDTVATFNGHQLTGLLSNVGILLWTVAASVCFFSYALYRQLHRSSNLSQFFLWFGLFTSALLADDLFLLHEEESSFHIPEKLLFVIYLSVLLLILKRFRRVLFQQKSLLFWLSLVFFSLSIGIDLPNYATPIKGMVFVEDAFKFLGIVSWSGFLVTLSFKTLMATLNQQTQPTSLTQKKVHRS